MFNYIWFAQHFMPKKIVKQLLISFGVLGINDSIATEVKCVDCINNYLEM